MWNKNKCDDFLLKLTQINLSIIIWWSIHTNTYVYFVLCMFCKILSSMNCKVQLMRVGLIDGIDSKPPRIFFKKKNLERPLYLRRHMIMHLLCTDRIYVFPFYMIVSFLKHFDLSNSIHFCSNPWFQLY